MGMRCDNTRVWEGDVLQGPHISDSLGWVYGPSFGTSVLALSKIGPLVAVLGPVYKKD